VNEPKIMFCYKCKSVSEFKPRCPFCGISIKENEKLGEEFKNAIN